MEKVVIEQSWFSLTKVTCKRKILNALLLAPKWALKFGAQFQELNVSHIEMKISLLM